MAERAEAGPGPGVFSRPASGLIRVAGTWDVFIFNVGLVSIGIAIAFNQYYGPSLYPGVDTGVSTLLATLGMLFVAGAFYFWSVTFPRSGGVYVFLSRSMHPGVAFVLSLLETVILCYYGALAASLIPTVGLSSFFATVGSITGNDTLVGWAAAVAGPKGIFWIGTAVLVVAGAVLVSGTRRYFTVQRVLFVIAVVGTLVLLAALLFGSRSTFEENLTEQTGLTASGVVATAEENGFVTAPFSWDTTFKFLVWPLLPLLGAVQSVTLGGEIKRVRRSQFLGIVGALVATGVVIAIFGWLSDKVFGETLQGALSYNSLLGLADATTDGTIGAPPWFTTLAGILTANGFLAVIIMATFVAWIWFWVPAELAYATRTMIAWSFDRLAPDKLGYVSETLHTPVVAITVSTVVGVFFMWLIAFHGIAFLTLIEIVLIVWGAALVAAIWFPRTRRALFEASPASQYRIGGVPTMSIVGALGAAFFAYVMYLLWNDPIAAGPLFTWDSYPKEFWMVLGLTLFGVAWYVGTRLYRRRQGIDVSLAFQQLPIE